MTIIELLPRLVPNEDEAVSAELEKHFKKLKIKVLTDTEGDRRSGRTRRGRRSQAQLPDGSVETLKAEYLLVATGRGPVTDGLGRRRRRAARWSAATSAWTSCSGRRCRASRPWATSSRWAGRVIRSSRTCRRPRASSSPSGSRASEVRPINYDHVPKCTYCDPEIGSVGLTEKQAIETGLRRDASARSRSACSAGRRIAGETAGFVKIVADKKYDEILGVHMIGPRSTELVAEATMALRMECTVEELIRTIHAHPTMSEAVGEAAHATHGAAIHM